jgi:hypothetical protein
VQIHRVLPPNPEDRPTHHEGECVMPTMPFRELKRPTPSQIDEE